MSGLLDIRLYVRVVDYLNETRVSTTGKPSWLDATNNFAKNELGLDEDAYDYFINGVNRLVGNTIHAGHWDDMAENADIDRVIWTFLRAWIDLFGPVYKSEPWETPGRG